MHHLPPRILVFVALVLAGCSAPLPDPAPVPGPDGASGPLDAGALPEPAKPLRLEPLGAPLRQDISRTAFLVANEDRCEVHFSTLESYHRGPGPDRFALHAFSTEGESLGTTILNGSIEARSHAFHGDSGLVVLGASLEAQLLMYDPARREAWPVFQERSFSSWVHALAVQGDTVLTIPSRHPSAPPSPLLRLDTRLGTLENVTLPAGTASYGGVDSVDSHGRVWFYRAFPFEQSWYHPSSGIQSRTLADRPGAVPDTWDHLGADFFVIFPLPGGAFEKVRIDPETLAELPPRPEHEAFLKLLPLDYHHKGDPVLGQIYIDPSGNVVYRVDSSIGVPVELARLPQGTIVTPGSAAAPQERGIAIRNHTFGLLQVLGEGCGRTWLWVEGQKTLLGVAHATSEVVVIPLAAPNLSPAVISDLVAVDSGLYGAGVLTNSNLFRLEHRGEEAETLLGAIPHAEGQIDVLASDLQGRVYGVGYPGARPFRYDPAVPWLPGTALDSNPRALPGPDHGQMRGLAAVASGDALWYASVSDYSAETVHALVRADFASGGLTVRVAEQVGLRRIKDIAASDPDNLVLLGTDEDGRAYLQKVNMKTLSVTSSVEAPSGAALLAGPPSGPAFLTVGPVVYEVGPQLDVQEVRRMTQNVSAIVPLNGSVCLLGSNEVECLDEASGTWRTWRGRAEEPLFPDTSYSAAAAFGSRLFLAQGENLFQLNMTGS
jgi:hypothetical protein